MPVDGVAIGSMLHYALTEANNEGQVKIEGGEFQISLTLSQTSVSFNKIRAG